MWYIRSKWPDPDGNCTGYKPGSDEVEDVVWCIRNNRLFYCPNCLNKLFCLTKCTVLPPLTSLITPHNVNCRLLSGPLYWIWLQNCHTNPHLQVSIIPFTKFWSDKILAIFILATWNKKLKLMFHVAIYQNIDQKAKLVTSIRPDQNDKIDIIRVVYVQIPSHISARLDENNVLCTWVRHESSI